MTKKKKRIIGVIVVVVILIFIIIFSSGKNGDQANSVQTEKAGLKKIVETVTATGRIQPVTQVKISADVAGKITILPVKEGDWVEKGTLLVQLEKERYAAALEQAEANLRSVEANAQVVKENETRAEKDYIRLKELYDRQLESRAALDQAYAAVQVEKARYQSSLEQVDQARAAMKQSRDDLSKTTIYAPMSGTISTLNKEVGEIALGSQFQEDVIMIISNLSSMEALVNVDENDIVRVSLNDSAAIEVDALPDKLFTGTVSEIANSAKISGSGTTEQKTEFEVKIAIADPGKELRQGMTASADIITEVKPEALGIPIQSVTVRTLQQLQPPEAGEGEAPAEADSLEKPPYVPDKDGFVPIVFVVENGVSNARQVKTGIQSETYIEILDGIAEGDEIVTGSYRAISQTLQNGSPVVVDNPKK
ncbi:efflux RND transporter periplasmic adaptor subunit [candidate division KSB1 bacterium]|nr:efflux RND transporter periplasmic adaptor subunit [candidate division KSB1 bacterium]